MPSVLHEGDAAPEFTLPDQHNTPVSLSDFRGRRVMLYFYPKADTPGCTTQSCGLRDIAGLVGDTAIVGVSPDDPDDQRSFDEKHHLGFPLLADLDGAVARAYDVWGVTELPDGRNFTGMVRSAFLIDAAGQIERAWYRVSPLDTPQFLLLALSAS